jgi:hypothetical protein
MIRIVVFNRAALVNCSGCIHAPRVSAFYEESSNSHRFGIAPPIPRIEATEATGSVLRSLKTRFWGAVGERGALRCGGVELPDSENRGYVSSVAVLRSLKTQFWGAVGERSVSRCGGVELPDAENRGYGGNGLSIS